MKAEVSFYSNLFYNLLIKFKALISALSHSSIFVRATTNNDITNAPVIQITTVINLPNVVLYKI